MPDYLRVNPFGVPEGYFNHLENNILAKIAEQKLKQQVSDTGFAVPPDYFAQLEEHIQGRLFEQKLKDSISADSYQVPQGYFEELTDRIKASVALEQLMTPTKEEGFEVPTGYFESLSSRIMDKVADSSPVDTIEKSTTPVIQMSSKRNWVRYASAAAIAMFVGIGSYWYMDQSTSTTPQADPAQASLQEISNEEIVRYLAQVADGEELIELATYVDNEAAESDFEINTKVNDKEIEEYLKYML